MGGGNREALFTGFGRACAEGFTGFGFGIESFTGFGALGFGAGVGFLLLVPRTCWMKRSGGLTACASR